VRSLWSEQRVDVRNVSSGSQATQPRVLEEVEAVRSKVQPRTLAIHGGADGPIASGDMDFCWPPLRTTRSSHCAGQLRWHVAHTLLCRRQRKPNMHHFLFTTISRSLVQQLAALFKAARPKVDTARQSSAEQRPRANAEFADAAIRVFRTLR
jgi:hypothetical protein